MTVAYIGLGSNLGERAAEIWDAVRRVNAIPGCQLLRLAALYETEPVGVTDQPWFLNTAIAIETKLDPTALLDELKRIEREMGRSPGPRWGPRPIDLDILLYGDVCVETEALTLPHAELWNRRFVLAPLASIIEPVHLADRVEARLRDLPEVPRVRLLGA